MKCFNCGRRKMRTIYPEGYVQKVCDTCGYKSFPVKIPVSIPRCQELPEDIPEEEPEDDPCTCRDGEIDIYCRWCY